MAAVNRAALLTKLHKVLKKHYQPVAPASGRSVLETLLFAACLENSPYDKAEEAFTTVSKAYFDWNEVRVSTVKELSEVMKAAPDPEAAATRLRRSLQAVFEANYSFDLEPMKKLNIGAAVQKLSSYDGVSPFAVSYVAQTSLGGHAIPLDDGAMGALAVLGLVGPDDKPKDGVTGIERAIPKNKGVEFGSLLHQLSVDFTNNPYSTNLHKILLEVDPQAKARLPKRQSKTDKKPEPAPEPVPAAKSAKPGQKPADAKGKPDGKAKPAEADAKKSAASGKKAAAPTPAAAAKKSAASAKSAEKKPAAKSISATKRKPR